MTSLAFPWGAETTHQRKQLEKETTSYLTVLGLGHRPSWVGVKQTIMVLLLRFTGEKPVPPFGDTLKQALLKR